VFLATAVALLYSRRKWSSLPFLPKFTFAITHMRATFPTHLILDLMILAIFGEGREQ
jgi:hypothetical protein